MRGATAIGLLAATILIAPSLAPGLSGPGAEASADGPAKAEAAEELDCRPHPPIVIEEETGPQGFTLGEDPRTGEPIHRPGSGVVGGTGIEEDPYLIEGWCLRPVASGISGDVLEPLAALRIADTDAHVVVQDNEFTGRPEAGLQWGAMIAAANVTIQDNAISMAENGFANGGVVLWGATGSAVIDNEITENEVGVAIFDAEHNTVAGNTITDSWSAGISVGTSDADRDPSLNRIVNNSVHGADHGVWVKDATDVSFADNDVSNHIHTSMLLQNVARITVEHNRIADSEEGLHASHAQDLQVEANNVTGNGDGLRIYGWQGSHEVTGNNIWGNMGVGLYASDVVDAPGNWWGCPDGPNDEACDDVTGIDVEDWLTEPTPDAGPR